MHFDAASVPKVAAMISSSQRDQSSKDMVLTNSNQITESQL